MFGFNNKETKVLLFLVFSLLLGLGIKIYRSRWAPLPTIAERAIEKNLDEKHKPATVDSEDKKDIFVHQKIILNKATQVELESLPGIGPVTAKRIIEHRNRIREFHSIEGLLEVRGIGHKTIEKIKPFLKLD